jgi:hypothetical protein
MFSFQKAKFCFHLKNVIIILDLLKLIVSEAASSKKNHVSFQNCSKFGDTEDLSLPSSVQVAQVFNASDLNSGRDGFEYRLGHGQHAGFS